MSSPGFHNPSTRLGGSNFNHQQDSSAEEEYDRLRNLARQEHGRMSSCFDRAHQAHTAGNGAEAHELSAAGKQHQSAAAAYNKQASDYIFLQNNANGRVAGDTIDLHGQFVEEAEEILEARIRAARAEHQTHLHVIVGKGNHSPGHVQKIKPRVERVCEEMGLRFRTEENAGRVFVDLTGGEIDYQVPEVGQAPGKYQGGYSGQGGQQGGHAGGGQQGSHAGAAGGGGYPGQGQQQGQYGHQQQQGQYGSQQQPQYGQGYQGGPPQQQFQQEQQEQKGFCRMCCTVM